MGRVRWSLVRLAVGAMLWPVAARAVVLDHVRLRAGARPAIELALSGPVVPWVRKLAATPNDPYRIYIDLADTVLGASVPKVLSSDVPGIERVRTGQFTPTTARIVLDTSRELAFEVETTDRRVTIAFAAADGLAASAVPEILEPPNAPDPEPAVAAPPTPDTAGTPAAPAPAATAAATPSAPDGPASAPVATTAPPPTAATTPPPAASPSREHPAASRARLRAASWAPPRDSDLPLVVVDAGHGGHDPGAEGVGGILEKTVALQIAHRLAAKLPARLPVDSLLTRSDDSFVPLSNRLPHRGTREAIFLSLHANACDDPAPRGLEIFFGDGGEREDELRGKHLARLVTRELRARLLRVRGRPRPGPFSVLTANDAPSILVELGYLTHPDDAARLQDPRYQELLTDALVDAVATFLQSGRGTTASVQHRQDLVPSGNPSRRMSTLARSGAS